jgi:hypothetical protein
VAPPAWVSKGIRPRNDEDPLADSQFDRSARAPGYGCWVIPGWLLVTRGGAIGAGLPSPVNLIVAATGLTFATLGLFLAVGAIRRFSIEGEGTLAPGTRLANWQCEVLTDTCATR